jgi:uncharacterized protein YrrD
MIQLIKNAEVFSSVGEKIGSLDRVVLDPETRQVSHIVVTKGILFSTSKVIPVSYIDLDGKRITLTKNASELEDLPDFEETSYIKIDETSNPGQNPDHLYFYPPQNDIWWGFGGWMSYPIPKYVVKTRNNIPDDMVALDEGADVVSRYGKDVGTVEEVMVEPSENRATHILVSRGLFSKEHKLIPTLWIKKVSDEKIVLSIDSDMFDRLPEHERVA